MDNPKKLATQHRRRKKTKNTTQYGLDTTMRKQTEMA